MRKMGAGCSNRARGSSFKLKKGRFSLEIRTRFSVIRVVKHWPGFSRQVVDAPSLETFQARMDGALSNLIPLKMSLPMAEGLD